MSISSRHTRTILQDIQQYKKDNWNFYIIQNKPFDSQYTDYAIILKSQKQQIQLNELKSKIVQLIICIDKSGSMITQTKTGNHLYKLVSQSILQLIPLLNKYIQDQIHVQLAVITYESNANIVFETSCLKSEHLVEIEDNIENWTQPSGSTNFYNAYKKMQVVLDKWNDVNQNINKNNILSQKVLLTDGFDGSMLQDEIKWDVAVGIGNDYDQQYLTQHSKALLHIERVQDGSDIFNDIIFGLTSQVSKNLNFQLQTNKQSYFGVEPDNKLQTYDIENFRYYQTTLLFVSNVIGSLKLNFNYQDNQNELKQFSIECQKIHKPTSNILFRAIQLSIITNEKLQRLKTFMPQNNTKFRFSLFTPFNTPRKVSMIQRQGTGQQLQNTVDSDGLQPNSPQPIQTPKPKLKLDKSIKLMLKSINKYALGQDQINNMKFQLNLQTDEIYLSDIMSVFSTIYGQYQELQRLDQLYKQNKHGFSASINTVSRMASNGLYSSVNRNASLTYSTPFNN